MDASAFIRELEHDPAYHGQIAATRVLPARRAEYGAPRRGLPDVAKRVLKAQGVERLYSHQADALDALSAGEDIVLSSGTASGKSLCFQLPLLEKICADRDARALLLYPVKALAYDQLATLDRIVCEAGIQDVAKPACYDGDTPGHKRPGIRRNATVLLSNPDMLHVGMLPYHAKWAAFLAGLEYVVLDEIHMYRGVFGSHVAGVIRRLLRLCRHYGSSPRFVCCSATIGNPCELAERLTSRTMRVIDRDGSPRGRKHFVLWNPPWLGETRVARRSGNIEAQELMQKLLERGAGTIAFAKARVVAELLYKYVSEALAESSPELARRVRPYRGGYLSLERREIEKALFGGELLGVCSTNALELGIDVGTLDAAIIVGFPSTLCSLWQQAGRAGRRAADSLAVFVAYDDPVDQYLMRNPGFIFDRSLESAIIDPWNPHVLAAQLSCAAFELPLAEKDWREFGGPAADVARVLKQDDKLRRTDEKYYWSSSEMPAAGTNLRTISDTTYSIVDVSGDGGGAVLAKVDGISAPELVYPEAVYLHHGESYVVRELDIQARLARVERLDADYYTQPVLASEIRVGAQRLESGRLGGTERFCEATVRWQTVAFRKFKFYTMELIGQTALELPALQIETVALALQPPPGVLQAVARAGHKKSEALSGVRNLLLVALPPLAMCDRHDIGGIVDSSQLGATAIFIYDRFEGGIGYARHAFEKCDVLLRAAREMVAACECDDGCPGCVGPPNLRVPIHHDPDIYHGLEFPDKHAALALLDGWVG